MIHFAKRLLPLLLLVWQCQSQDPTEPPAAEDGTAAPTIAPAEWGGCVDTEDRFALVTIGKKTTLCLVLTDGPDWGVERKYLRLSFQPIADQYSRYHVPYSFNELFIKDNAVSQLFAGSNITVHAESQTALSFQKRYYDGFAKIFPHLTAIVNVLDGVVTGISWDDAGVFCGKGESEPNTFDFAGNLATEAQAQQPVRGCYMDLDDECTKYHAEGRTDCDMILYVVWTGTDANGKSFLSSGYRFSAFPAQELGDRFSQNLPSLPDVSNILGGADDEGDGA